jgi:C4-dicarboxylate-specific signal transduction histidine kinase
MRVSTVGELAAGLAHELNQPLSSISNLVGACGEHVRSGNLSPEKHLELLAEITNESQRAAGIVAHLRSFIDKGNPEFEPVDLVEIVARVPQLLMWELDQARVALRMDLSTEPLHVDADAIQIEQVLVNLIQNAIHSIQESERPDRMIELSVRLMDGTGEVGVHDTGMGVSVAVAEHMFDAFFTTKSDGLGMGLALSRSILEAHRGRIWMDAPSDGGAGTVMRFAIPLKPPMQRVGDQTS